MKEITDIGIIRENEWLVNYRFEASKTVCGADSFYNYKRHYHNFYEFEFVESGETSYEINNVLTPLAAGSAHLITPIDSHCQIIGDSESFAYSNISFCEDFVSEEVLSALYSHKQNLIVNFNGAEYAEVKKGFAEVCVEFNELAENKKRTCARRYAKNILENLLIIFLRALEKQDAESAFAGRYYKAVDKDNRIIRDALTYVRLNYNGDINLTNAAEYLGLSRTYFCTFFNNAMNMSFWEYVQTYRMNLAASMLVNTNMTSDYIARDVGYHSYSSFYTAFKKRFGVPPNEYKKYYT